LIDHQRRELALDRERWNNRSMARRQKTSAGSDEDTEQDKPDPAKKSEDKAADTAADKPASDAKPQPSGPAERPSAKDLPDITPPAPRAEPWPDATPPPMKPVEPPAPAKPVEAPELRAARTATATMAMPLGDLGKPPEMPHASAPPPLVLGSVEEPTHMPGPKDVPGGAPDDPAPPPGRVPPGDSRSFRRGNEFALIYRVGTCVITRTGVVGRRGQWRVVEYPTSAAAGSSYAKECSRFVSEGFSDYRD
jgi:hypothetical protein